MNETEKKMFDYLQSLIDGAKVVRLDEHFGELEIDKEIVANFISAFHTCAGMFKAVTGKEVTFREWKVCIKEGGAK